MSGSTGQIIGGVVGAVIGFYAGGNVATGWAIGSAIGGAIDPQRIDGPRLQDRKIQVSSYGAGIPIIYGGDSGTGNVIWSTDLQEHDVDEDGKGGPVVTNHTYSVSCAILIGEGPIAGIRRIWADAKLVYDVSVDADEQTQLASFIFSDYFTFYPGTETQLPDPTMEAALGVGNVPAYLGVAYIVFNDIPLQDYGNRLPTFRFETSEEATEESTDDGFVYEPLRIYPWSGDRPAHSAGDTQFRANDGTLGTDYDTARVYNATLFGGSTGIYSESFIGGYETSLVSKASVFSGGASLDGDPQYVYYYMGAQAFDVVIPHSGAEYPFPDSSLFCGATRVFGATPDDGLIYWTQDFENLTGTNNDSVVKISSTDSFTGPFQNVNNCTNYAAPGTVALGNRVIPLRAERLPAPPADSPGCMPGDPCLLGLAQIPDQPDFCISCDGTITPRAEIDYEVISGTFKQLCAVQYRSGALYQNALGPVHLPADPEYDDPDYWAGHFNTALAAGLIQSDVTFPVVVSEVARGTLSNVTHIIAEEANTTLDVIVADVCARAGMPAGTVNVEALEDIEVQGYSIARQMPARQAILPLQQAFWWDFVESGREIKAVLRGAEPVDTIDVDDLGATEGSESLVAVVPNRGQEAELPATVNIAYPVREKGYEAGAQRARRVTTGSNQVMSLELAIVMPDQKASDIADVQMYTQWTNRTQRSWSTTRKWAHYEPTDRVRLDDGEFVVDVRVTEKSEEGGVVNWKGVDESPAGYSPITTPGFASGNAIGSIRYDGPMKLELMDIPIVMDTDDDPGFYAAAAGYRESYPGGTAYKSIDDGASYTKAKTMNAKATLGYATTVLGDWAGGNMVDEANSVTVRMHNGTLSSITQAQLLSAGNAALLGDELIQFKRAELLVDGYYKLTGLLRGRRGTEQHMGTHAVDDRFVLMTSNTVYRIAGVLGEIGMATKWKGVTFGLTLDSALEQDFTNSGAGLKPLSPVHLQAVDIGGGDYRIQWVRRTRIGGTWRDGVDAPLGETSESYAVVVNNDPAVIVSEPEAEVAAAPGDTVTVYQLSSTVGRGFPASIEI